MTYKLYAIRIFSLKGEESLSFIELSLGNPFRSLMPIWDGPV
jgi:hypothetical protein